MNYYQSKIIANTTVEKLRPKVEEELKKVGFGVLTEIDIQKTMKKKLDKEYLPHLILGACSPVYADKIISVEPHISTLLPCNVTLRDLGDGNVEVSSMNPLKAMQAVKNEKVKPIAEEVQNQLSAVLKNL